MKKLEFINVNDRRIIEGPKDNLVQISPVKYPKPMARLEKMMRDNWFQWDVNLMDDKQKLKEAPPQFRRMYQKGLGFLSNIDGMQLTNLTMNVGRYITSPEYATVITRQAYEEALHVVSYQTMIETMDFDAVETYNLFMTDEIHRAKNEHVMQQTFILGGDNYSPQNFVRAMAANQALEGIYFQMGFANFYVLDKVIGTHASAQMIRYIHRDELNHLGFFNDMWWDLRAERPELFTFEVLQDCLEIIRNAALMEIIWGKHLIEGGVLGMTDEIIEGHVKFIANEVAVGMGLDKPFPEIKNDPMDWVTSYMKSHGIETNFFEEKVIEYEDKPLEW